MQFVGEVQAIGLTAEALAAALETKLSAYIHEPEVTVFVREYNGYRFSIMGAIRSPGVYDLAGPVTLLEAVALAGGLTDWAKRKEVKIIHPQEDRADQVYNLADIERGKISDPALTGGEIIIVKRRFF